MCSVLHPVTLITSTFNLKRFKEDLTAVNLQSCLGHLTMSHLDLPGIEDKKPIEGFCLLSVLSD